MEVSINKLIHENAELHKRKRCLLDQKAEIDKQIKNLDNVLIEHAKKSEISKYPIENADVPPGFFAVRTKTDHDSLTKVLLQKLCVEFQMQLADRESVEAAEKYGQGQAEWLWSHRAAKQVTYVERVYVETEKDKEKKGDQPKKKRQRAQKLSDDVPITTDDFLEVMSR